MVSLVKGTEFWPDTGGTGGAGAGSPQIIRYSRRRRHLRHHRRMTVGQMMFWPTGDCRFWRSGRPRAAGKPSTLFVTNCLFVEPVESGVPGVLPAPDAAYVIFLPFLLR